MSMISDLSNCLYEVNLIDCSCKSNDSNEYTIYINIAYKKFSDHNRYYNLSFRINTSPYTGIDIVPGTKNGPCGCVKCLKKMAMFYIMIIYPDAFESVDMGEYEYD